MDVKAEPVLIEDQNHKKSNNALSEMSKQKIIRITTVGQSMAGILKGQLRFMNNHYEVIGISSGGDSLCAVEENEGIKTYAVNMTRRISPLRDLKALVKLYRIIRNEKPTIVHTHTPKAGILGMVASYLARVPVRIHTVAGLPLMEATGAKRILLENVEKLTYRCASKVYPNSAGLSDFINSKSFCIPDKVKVIGHGSSNGIDTSFFSQDEVTEETLAAIREKYSIPESAIVFCFVGRIVGDKGINELLAAFVKIHEKHPNSRLLLVGPFERELDKLSDESEQLIREHEGVIWTDYQTDVRPFFSLSDVFTFPSYREGFPNVVMQAGAMKLPCIVSDINGCNEIVKDGVNGLIVPPKEVESLYRAMETLFLNEELRKNLSAKARQMIIDKYERKVMWKKLLHEYDEVIAGLKLN
ncbi:glycosyltransferase family 4 protein [Carboxylicivirga sp. RSCT41]|uniref:glycosyltransferase family 4 protein n=1 Tax=Carboxylicivirga agarovorans TaxID=3417570 RepID=UPI003D346874